MKKYLLLAGLQLSLLGNKAQTSLYFENFEGSATALPTGWVSAPATNGWAVTTTNTSTNYIGASGANNIKIDNNAPTATYSIITKPVATTGYSAITVSWGARFTTNFGPSNITPLVYYSTNNGASWASTSYTEASSGSVWSLNAPVSIPAAADNQAAVQFMLVANITNNASGTYRMDDFQVKGTAITTNTTIATAIKENALDQSLTFYVSNKLLNYSVSSSNTELSAITLLDLTGKPVLIKTTPNEHTVNLSGFENGIYIVRFDSKNGQTVSKKVALFN